MEVFLKHQSRIHLILDFLHVCGGVSDYASFTCKLTEFSPRMWRCFSCAYVARYCTKIFSTYVEVFLRKFSCKARLRNFLHVCGGVSQWRQQGMPKARFSPRMWRCFSDNRFSRNFARIFSTYVEVFPKSVREE